MNTPAPPVTLTPEELAQLIDGTKRRPKGVGRFDCPVVFFDRIIATITTLQAEVDRLSHTQAETPKDIILHCRKCGLQHIDMPGASDSEYNSDTTWTNPPHKSHLCHGCGYIWRPADFATNGVAAIKSRGSNDSPEPAQAETAGGVQNELARQFNNWKPEPARAAMPGRDWVIDCILEHVPMDWPRERIEKLADALSGTAVQRNTDAGGAV